MTAHSASPSRAATRPAATPFEVMALICVLALGVYVRVDDLSSWTAQADVAFHEGRPLLVNLDGYFFLSLARDLLEGVYLPLDELRAAPMGDTRPVPPPLLSVITAALGALTTAPLDWIAALLPPIVGPLAALPVYAIARRLEGPVAGLAAALITVLSTYYVFRSTVGFYDTDCLNVTLVLAMCWWSLRLARAPGHRFAGWMVLGVAFYLLFLWWWYGAHTVVTAVAAWCLLCAMVSRRRSSRERLAALAVCAALAIAALVWRGPSLPASLLQDLEATLSHVSKASQGDFPNVAISIGEQSPSDLASAADQTIGDPWLLTLASLGLLWLLAAHRRAAVVLLLPLAFALMSGLFAQRFLVFVAPMSGLGVGMLAARGMRAVRRVRGMQVAIVAGVLAFAAPSWARSTGYVFMPAASSELVSGMRWLATSTPSNAVVWAIWDFGYTLRYFGRRATVNDGSVHTGELTVLNAMPYAAASFRQAANFMQFYSVHGLPGMRRLFAAAGGPAAGLDLARRVFAAGPHQGAELLRAANLPALDPESGVGSWIDFLFPADAPPLYLLNDRRMLYSARWWYWFGTYDVKTRAGQHGELRPFDGLRRAGALVTGPGLTVDVERGIATLEDGQRRRLSRVLLGTGGRIERRDYAHSARSEFHFFPERGFGALQGSDVAQSVFSKTFVLELFAPRYFQRAIPQGSREFQIWRVTGDRVRARRRASHEPRAPVRSAALHQISVPKYATPTTPFASSFSGKVTGDLDHSYSP